MRFPEKLLLMGAEATYGAGASLDGSHFVRAIEVVITAEGEELTDETERGTEGAYEAIPFGEHVTLTFKTHLFGSGTAGVAPPYSALFLACRFAEVVVADTSVAYALASDFGGSNHAEFRIGNNLHAISGMRGNVEVMFEKGIPKLSWTFKGLWTAPSHTTDSWPTIDQAPWVLFEPTGPGRTSGFTLHGQSLRAYSLTLNPGNEAIYDESLTDAQIAYSGRNGSGKVQIEAPTLDTINFFARNSNRQHGALAITHGSAAGNIVTLACPVVQNKKPSYTKLDNNNVGYDMDLVLLPDAGNDEISFLFT